MTGKTFKIKKFLREKWLSLKLNMQRFLKRFYALSLKKRALIFILIFLCFVLIVIVTNTISSYRENHQALQTENAPIPVITAQVKNVNVPQSIEAVGNMQAISSVPVSFDADGILGKIYVKDGEQVKKGELIATLDYRADTALLQSYQANLALQKANYQRMLSIKNTGAISDQMLDGQKATWQQAVAQVNQQKIVISQQEFYAPFGGVVSNFTASSGSYLAKGTAISTLIQEAPLVVQYSLPVSDRPIIELGQPVMVTSAAYPGQSFSGVLSYVSPLASSTSGTMILQATVSNPDFLLLPGMFVSVSQLVNPNRALPMVPDVALMTDVVGQYVFKVNTQQQTVRKIYVAVGQSIGNQIPVNSGLNIGDTVVIAGQQKLGDGSKITKLNDPELIAKILSDTQVTEAAS